MNLSKSLGMVVLLSVGAMQASATDVATLRNGFTIRHESRAPLGETTRLFLTSDGSSFVDVPTAEIVQIEPDLNAPVAPEKTAETLATAPAATDPSMPAAVLPQPASSRPADIAGAVNSASGRYRIDPDLVNSVIRAESGLLPLYL
jgi:soluble lytic murein transglycosylase-like protein